MAINFIKFDANTLVLDRSTCYPKDGMVPLLENERWISFDSALVSVDDLYDTLQPEEYQVDDTDSPIYEAQEYDDLDKPIYEEATNEESGQLEQVLIGYEKKIVQVITGYNQKTLIRNVLKVDPSKVAAKAAKKIEDDEAAEALKYLQDTDYKIIKYLERTVAKKQCDVSEQEFKELSDLRQAKRAKAKRVK